MKGCRSHSQIEKTLLAAKQKEGYKLATGDMTVLRLRLQRIITSGTFQLQK